MNLFKKISCQNIVATLITAAPLLWPSIGFSLIDATLQVGPRNADWSQDSTSSKASSQVIKAGFHLDPIPLVPVSFGLGLYSETWKVSEADQGLKSLSSFSVVPEVVVWLPLGDIKPFARVGYSILSGYAGKAVIGSGTQATEGSIALAGVGLHVGAGLEYSIPLIPLLSAMGEIEYASERVKLAKDEVAGVNISGAYKPITLTSTAILVGAKLGF